MPDDAQHPRESLLVGVVLLPLSEIPNAPGFQFLSVERKQAGRGFTKLDVAGYCLAEQMRMVEMDIDSISRDAVVSGGSSSGRWWKEVRLDLLIQGDSHRRVVKEDCIGLRIAREHQRFPNQGPANGKRAEAGITAEKAVVHSEHIGRGGCGMDEGSGN